MLVADEMRLRPFPEIGIFIYIFKSKNGHININEEFSFNNSSLFQYLPSEWYLDRKSVMA